MHARALPVWQCIEYKNNQNLDIFTQQTTKQTDGNFTFQTKQK